MENFYTTTRQYRNRLIAERDLITEAPADDLDAMFEGIIDRETWVKKLNDAIGAVNELLQPSDRSY